MKKFLTLVALAAIAVPAAAYAQDKPGLKEPGKMFKDTDTNGDGLMSKEEFMTFHEKRFTEMDKDGNGQIDADEARAKAKEWREKMKERRQEMIEKRGEMKGGDAPAAETPATAPATETPAVSPPKESVPASPVETPSETLPAQ